MNEILQELPEGFEEFYYQDTLFAYQHSTGEDWQVVDHIRHATGEPEQDKISNLRITTISGNALNKRVAKTSRYKGVCFDKTKGKWRAQARHICTGRKKGLGYFDDEYQAHLAYEAYTN